MSKYTPQARQFIAACYLAKVPYPAARAAVLATFGVVMPQGTYAFQRSYLKHRTPSEMAAFPATAIGNLAG
jgi:hypothetical protein